MRYRFVTAQDELPIDDKSESPRSFSNIRLLTNIQLTLELKSASDFTPPQHRHTITKHD